MWRGRGLVPKGGEVSRGEEEEEEEGRRVVGMIV
jgi:hypothetical protein